MRKTRTGMFAGALLAGAVSAVVLSAPAFGGALSGANPLAVARSLIGGEQVKDNSITGADIKDRSLTRADFDASFARSSARRRGPRGRTGPRGYTGPQGAQGAQGSQGPAGVQRIFVVEGGAVSVPPGYVGAARADCPAGSTVIGTGFYAGITDVGFVERFGSFVGIAAANNTGIYETINAQAICGQLAPGVSASAYKTASRRASERKFDQKVEQLKARTK